MNNIIKGSIAGATGVALLMGGFGTYALWSDSETLGESDVASGNMGVSAGTASFSENEGASTAAYSGLMVPGDEVVRSQTFTFTGAGQNLTGAIRFDMGDQTEFGNPLTTDAFQVKVTVDGTLVDTSESDGCWNFTVDDINGAGEVVATTVEYTLKATGTNHQDQTAAIEDSTFTITQGVSC